MRDDTSPPLVSVVTPCHNAEPFVGETIEAVLKQTHPAVEHVLVDDASSDGSWAVIERYAQAHPERVRGVRLQENRGASHARKRGAELARGEFLMFLDADDLIADDSLASLVAAAAAAPDAIGVTGWSWLRRVDGRWVEVEPDVPFPDLADPLRGWLEGRWAPTCSVLWRRDVYERSGGWDENLLGNDDGDLMLRGFAGGARLVRAEGGASYYRAHGGGGDHVSLSSTMHFSEKVFGDFMVSYEKLARILEEQGRLDEYRTSIGIAYYRLPVVNFLETHPAMARECLRRAQEFAPDHTPPPVALGRTLPGRLLSRIVGIEGKERILRALARVGIMTPQRRRYLEQIRTQEQKVGGRSTQHLPRGPAPTREGR